MSEHAEYVEWVDSFSPAYGTPWVTRDTLLQEPDELIIVKSVGFVLRETKAYLMLVSNSSEHQVGGTIVIPKCSIVKRKKLKL